MLRRVQRLIILARREGQKAFFQKEKLHRDTPVLVPE